MTSNLSFTEVVRRKRPQKREENRSLIKLATDKLKVVSGKREGASIKSSCPVKSIFVYQLDPVVTGDEIKDLLAKENVPVRGIRRINKAGWFHGSFKVDINDKDFNRVLDEGFWPTDVCCREWVVASGLNNQHGYERSS
jgi:hypothetical protein